MQHPGVSPIDYSTPVGQLRSLVGDTASVPLDPPVAGMASYAIWSDADLEVVLAAQDGNQLRAAGTLYLQLAAAYAQQGKSIRTDDLAIDTKGRGADLLAIAKYFFDQADDTANAEANDFFQIIPFGGRAGRSCSCRPEGTPWPVGCGNC